MPAAFVRAVIYSCLALPCLALAQQQAVAQTTSIPADNASRAAGGSSLEGESTLVVVTVSVADNNEDSALSADNVVATAYGALFGFLAGIDGCWRQGGNQPFQYDAIEGYILAICPPDSCCNDDGEGNRLEPLYRRYCVDDESNALLTGSQLAMPQFSAQCASDPYGGGSGLLGYVFPNEDSDNDGLIDGMEAMYGMNPASNDSDCDGLLDGVEFPITTVQSLANDPRIGPCG